MKYIVGFFRFWYDFIVGDDWRVAAGVIVLLAAAVIAADHDVNAWWSMPLVVTVLLAASVKRAAHR